MVYDISCKTLILRVRFDEVHGFITVYDGTRYLVFLTLKNMMPYNRIRYLISDISYIFSHNYARTKIDSYDSLPLEKALTLHNVIILIKSVLKKNQKH